MPALICRWCGFTLALYLSTCRQQQRSPVCAASCGLCSCDCQGCGHAAMTIILAFDVTVWLAKPLSACIHRHNALHPPASQLLMPLSKRSRHGEDL